MSQPRCASCRTGPAERLATQRGVVYNYCSRRCQWRHRRHIARLPAVCADCTQPAIGDTDWCGQHVWSQFLPWRERR